MALVVARNCAIRSSRLLVVIDLSRSIRSSSRLDIPALQEIGSESMSIVFAKYESRESTMTKTNFARMKKVVGKDQWIGIRCARDEIHWNEIVFKAQHSMDQVRHTRRIYTDIQTRWDKEKKNMRVKWNIVVTIVVELSTVQQECNRRRVMIIGIFVQPLHTWSMSTLTTSIHWIPYVTYVGPHSRELITIFCSLNATRSPLLILTERNIRVSYRCSCRRIPWSRVPYRTYEIYVSNYRTIARAFTHWVLWIIGVSRRSGCERTIRYHRSPQINCIWFSPVYVWRRLRNGVADERRRRHFWKHI